MDAFLHLLSLRLMTIDMMLKQPAIFGKICLNISVNYRYQIDKLQFYIIQQKMTTWLKQWHWCYFTSIEQSKKSTN